MTGERDRRYRERGIEGGVEGGGVEGGEVKRGGVEKEGVERGVEGWIRQG